MKAARSILGWPGLGDIRFWLAFFFVIRLYGITNPPLETSDNWRQAATLMVTRNYVEQGLDLLHPRVDTAGEKSGIVGMELPLLNLFHFLVDSLFGYSAWHGRLIVLLISTLGVWAFHALARRYFSARTALFSALILTCSLWFSYSRKIMPDVFSLSIVLCGLLFAARFLDRRRPMDLALFAVLTMLGVLSKLPAVLLLAALVPMTLRSKVPKVDAAIIIAATAIALMPVLWWYFYWFPHQVETQNYWIFSMGGNLGAGAMEILACWPEALKKFWFHAMRFTGTGAFLLGLWIALRSRNKALLVLLLVSSLAFLLFIFKAGDGFCGNTYYVLPFIPIMALIAGHGLASLQWPSVAVLMLAAALIEGIANQQHDFRLTDQQKELLTLEPLLDQVSERSELVVINTDTPTALYFAHRKGWAMRDERVHRAEVLDSLAALGCRYAVIDKTMERERVLGAPVVAENERYRVHSLRAR